ncbi:DUF664 domain-containing protein [Microlunatus sp. GCM10028923]|uniref:mycothiol transferase n=1 Tax=Microlunatus sp. GCM10028923 TaxID=3273400 RepID=UPI00360E8DAC
MTWIAPDVDRDDPHELLIADERTMIDTRLELHRSTFLRKCAGLTGAQLAVRAAPPSDLSLLGLLRHLTQVERTWFTRSMAGAEDRARVYPAGGADLRELEPDQAADDYGRFLDEVAASREVAARFELDDVFHAPVFGRPASVRWQLLHMIEEYARHNGHADLLRQAVDGQTGW